MHTTTTWMDSIIAYLKDGILLIDKVEAKKLRSKCARYTLIDGVLYKRGFSSPYLRYLSVEEASYVLHKVHERICGNHSKSRAIAHKVLCQGYY